MTIASFTLAGTLEEPGRFVSRHSADFHHDPLTSVDQFVVRRAQIDHQLP